ncbi:MAG: hypothetical protein AB8G99_11845 [Planctomycetaceae bacterium]
MQEVQEQKQTQFVDRRSSSTNAPGVERRQFSTKHENDNPEIAELANAIDQYKIENRRRFITFEEIYNVIKGLGYHR